MAFPPLPLSLFPVVSRLLRPLIRLWARKTAPQTRGEIAIPGLEKSVRVVRDRYGVPHIFAAAEHDLFFAQGFVHAQERLWQMDMSRLSLSGRLAELFGDLPAPWREISIHFENRRLSDLDFFIRLLGLRRVARESANRLPEEWLAPLVAYGDGVNRYIDAHIKRLPVEFRLMRREPEPWRPEDSLTIGKGFAFFLSTSLLTRITLTAVAGKLQHGSWKLESLWPVYPEDAPSIARPMLGAAQELLGFINGSFAGTGSSPGGQGSNNWVVAPFRSETGKAILCSDPHLRMALPCAWYLAHLRASPSGASDGLEVWGGSIPGSPGIHMGCNRRIAWGVTAGLCDDADLYQEKLHPEHSELYLAGDEWKRMEISDEHIRVRGGREVHRTVRLTRHGPVISDALAAGSNGEALALKWSAHEPSQEFRVVYGVNRASNWSEFLDSLSHQVAPTLNYVYADVDGNIGYALAGRIPRRSQPNSFLPLPGWTGSHEWNGYLPFAEQARIFNPPEGLIATANNRIVDPAYPHYLSDLFDPPYRIRRIETLLRAKPRLSVADMKRIQRDLTSNHALEVLGHLKADLEAIARERPRLAPAIKTLLAWDGDCGETSVGAAIFHALHLRAARDLLTPDLGEKLTLAYLEIMNQPLQPIARILSDPDSPWFASRPRRARLESWLEETCAELERRLGSDTGKWHWGKLHTLTLSHPFGRSRLLAPIFSIGPLPSPGDGVTINMGYYRYSEPYAHIVGPSLRMIIPIGEWRQVRFILPSGQSGHFFSPHYADQTELWRRGEYLRLHYQEEEMKDWPKVELVPSPPHNR